MDTTVGRDRIDLSGTWQCRVLARTEFQLGVGIVEDTTDLPAQETLPVPSNWHRSGLANFHGRVEITRELPHVEGDGWWLCFGGVDYFAEVYADGKLLLTHEGGFEPFDVALPQGARTLALVIDAPREDIGGHFPYRKRQLKGIFTQWDPLDAFQESSGGCWGEVWLEHRSEPHLSRVRSTCFLVPRPAVIDGAYVPAGPRDARLLVDVEARASMPCRATLVAELCGVRAEREIVLPVGRSQHRIALTVEDPELWWPWDRGEPALHELVVRLGADELRRRIGLREIGFDESTGTLRCNGEPVALRGSNVVPEKWLASYDAKRAAADVGLAREAGLNALRVAAHVTAATFYDACDEAGMLVWQDLPLQWDYLIDDDLIREAADQVERIVGWLHDHPCIALWSAHNEPFSTDRENFSGPVLRAIRAADGTRPLHPFSDFREHAYPGWFSGNINDYALPPGGPFVSEFGALALPSVAECEALGAIGWPPAGPGWAKVLTEPAPLLDIAGVALGDSLDDLVGESQRYQARVIQVGVESYRTRRINFFHFALLDGWPCTSWSVVSHGRVKKLGYEALARAAQPVLIGADLSRRLISDAWDTKRFPVLLGIWVVNDTRQPLTCYTWRAALGGALVAEGVIDVPADGIARWSDMGERWPSWQPPDLEPGEHELELALCDANGATVSSNAYSITIVRRDLDLDAPAW